MVFIPGGPYNKIPLTGFNNELYLVSNGIESLLDIDLTPFLNPAYEHQFYVENGKLRYQIYNSDDNTVLFKTDAGVFSNFNFINSC